MEKYLGNKASLLPLIENFLRHRMAGATRISDLFAGTNNVGRYFRSRGWATAACDSNRFSYVLAQAYLGTAAAPTFDGLQDAQADPFRLRQLQAELGRGISRFGEMYLPGRNAARVFEDLAALADVLARLQVIGEENATPGVITDCYTAWGARSGFTSLRGTQGVRNYFSRPNALFLDGVLGTVRAWWREGRLRRHEVFLLLTSVLEEVVITANVNGTFHDFNRTRIWPNAEQSFQLRLPLIACDGPPAEIANADSMAAASGFAGHDVCYLDPPYNFRQYGAYYHLLNFIAAFPFLPDIETYVGGLRHVRGQHPEDDFASNFCYKDRFIDSLRRLIANADADHVVLSYYGGRNHWNHWSAVSEPTDEGLRELRALFEDRSLFMSSEVVPALEIRRNYQSRAGEQKELVNEYLFHGVRHARPARPAPQAIAPLAANVRWGLANEFGHTFPMADDGVEDGVRTVG